MGCNVKTVVLALCAALMLCLTGCWSGLPVGVVYNNVSIPIVVNGGDIETNNVGEASTIKWLGWVVVDKENLYEAAVRNAPGGRFGRIQRVEYFVNDFLGCGIYGIRIYGEKAKTK